MSVSTQRIDEVVFVSTAQAGRQLYRFYSIDVGNRIALAEDHECDSDRNALALGKKILLASNHPKVEVWFGKLRLGVLDKGLRA
jgi:hypothetical protein